MVFGILSLAATVPLLATSIVQLQNVAQETQDNNGSNAASTKTNKCHIKVVPSARMSNDIKTALRNRRLILKDGLVKLSAQDDDRPPHHLVTSYFLPFPNTSYDGLVTTIDDVNMLNWVYISTSTYRVTYGTRVVAEKELTGPMGLVIMADGSSKIVLDGWDGFMAVEDHNDEWSLYFDKDSNGLADKLDEVNTKRIAQVELHREMLE